MSLAASRPQLVRVFLFSAFYTLVAGAYAWATGNGEFIFYIIVMLVLAGAVAAVHARVGISRGLLWCLSIWGLLHMAGGLVPVPESWQVKGPIRVLYSLWLIPGYLKYDHVIHFYGFGVTTWLCWQAMNAGIRRDHGQEVAPSAGLLTVCAAAGMGFGALNEVVEFAATLMMAETNVGGYVNTGWDLVSNLLGCIFAVLLIRFGPRKERAHPQAAASPRGVASPGSRPS